MFLVAGRSTLASGQKENDLSWAPNMKPPGIIIDYIMKQ